MIKKSAIFCFIFLLIFLALTGASAFALADTGIDEIPLAAQRVLPSDYYELGELGRITVSSSGTVALIEKDSSAAYIRIIGAVERKKAASASLSRICAYDNYVIGNFAGGAYLSVYSIAEDAYNDVAVSSSMYDIAVDEDANRLYVLNNTKLVWYSLVAGATLNISYLGEYAFPADDTFVYPNRIAVCQGMVYLYHTNAIKVYSFDSLGAEINEVFSGLVSNNALDTLFCPLPDGFLLVKADGVYLNSYSQKVINVSESASDSELNSIKGIAASGGLIYVVDNAYGAVKLFSAEDYAFVKYYGSYGSGDLRLDSPTYVAPYADGIYVADTGNNRVMRYEREEGAFRAYQLAGTVPVSPKYVAVGGGGAYVSRGDSHLFYYESDTYANTYSFEDNIKGIAVDKDSAVYVAVGNKVLRKSASESVFAEYIQSDAPIEHLATGLFGRVVYTVSGGKLTGYFSAVLQANASIELSVYGIESAEIAGIDADYYGNVYIAADTSIMRFERTAEQYSLSAVYTVALSGKIAGLCISSEGDFYVTSAHSVLKIACGEIVSETNSGYSAPEAIEFPVRIVKGDGWMQTAPNNYEDMLYLDNQQYLLVFNSTVIYQQVEYYYVEYQAMRMYISKDGCTVVEGRELEDTYVKCLFDTVNIYQYPSATSSAIFAGLSRDDIIEVTGYVAAEGDEDIWGWYQVVYEDRLGYVQISSVVSAERPYIEVVRHYVKARSAHFGATIKVYAAPSADAEIIASVSDGTTVELTAPLDSGALYSEVRINGTIGYILTENLMERGLTNGQILAIVLSIVTVAASIVLALLFSIFKKRA